MRRKNILIVDRDKDFLSGLREGFIPFQNRYQVAFATNIAKANEILRKFTVHLILANVHLAGESGIELLLSVRRQYAGTHIVLYADDSSDELKKSACRGGAATVLDYPFKMDDLFNVLAHVFVKNSDATFFDSVPLTDLLQLIGMGNHSIDLIITDVNTQRGFIRIRDGNLIEAETSTEKGIDAITEMLSWDTPKIKTSKGSVRLTGSSKAAPVHDVLFRAVAQLDDEEHS